MKPPPWTSFENIEYFSKQYFERSPEQLGRIERALERVVGRPIKVNLSVDESVIQVRSPQGSSGFPPGVTERKVNDGSQDPLVQRALSVFGATVIRVETGESAVIQKD